MTGKVRTYRGDLAVTTMAQVFFAIYRFKTTQIETLPALKLC